MLFLRVKIYGKICCKESLACAKARTQNVHGQIHTIDRAKRLITVLKVQVRNARSSTEKLLEFSSDERSFLD